MSHPHSRRSIVNWHWKKTKVSVTRRTIPWPTLLKLIVFGVQNIVLPKIHILRAAFSDDFRPRSPVIQKKGWPNSGTPTPTRASFRPPSLHRTFFHSDLEIEQIITSLYIVVSLSSIALKQCVIHPFPPFPFACAFFLPLSNPRYGGPWLIGYLYCMHKNHFYW